FYEAHFVVLTRVDAARELRCPDTAFVSVYSDGVLGLSAFLSATCQSTGAPLIRPSCHARSLVDRRRNPWIRCSTSENWGQNYPRLSGWRDRFTLNILGVRMMETATTVCTEVVRKPN